MEEGEGEPIKEIYTVTQTGGEKKHAVPQAEVKEGPTEERQGTHIPLEANIARLIDAQHELTEAVMAQSLNLEQFLRQLGEQSKELTESLSRLPPKQERARWVDVEYDQEFYTRFTPTMEPKFYAQMESKERKIWDARWQLARAAFFKKVNAAFPEKLFENQELQLLTNEQMERLYNIPGVRQGLEWYANEIINPQTRIKAEKIVGRPEWITILECKDESEFELFRAKMREELVRSGILRDEQQAKEADVVAWNWIWCSNLIESTDSRYSAGGERHDNLPGKMISDDLRSTFHPQEKWENKCNSGVRWGAFGEWGVTQVERIKQFNKGKKIVFIQVASPRQFWQFSEVDKEADEEGGRVRVYTPECYPTITMKSFWEETKIKIEDEEMTLLTYLLNREEIPWTKVGKDPWIGYLPIKLKKATDLFKYFKPGVPMETQKFGYVKVWAEPIIDSLNRLPALRVKEKGGELTDRERHNLKIWAVYAAYGGVGHTDKQEATMNLGTMERKTLERALKDKNVRYLDKKEGLKIV